MSSMDKTSNNWTSLQAYVLSVVCLLVGLAGGWFIRGSQGATVTPAANAATSNPQEPSAGSEQPTPEQMRRMADKQATPLLERLQKEPGNADLLAKIGNIYYDTQQFPAAIEYYQRALKIRPKDASVRTDMATAYWYTGDADSAISEFNRVLGDEPNKPNTLFNLGVVQWRGKMNIEGALATWQRLLDTNPNYDGKPKVIELMAQVRKHSGLKAGTQAKAVPE